MTDEVKTLAEWLLDPTTIPGDSFASVSGKDGPVEVRVGIPGDIYAVAPHGGSAAVMLDYLRMKFMRKYISLDRLTAQQALDRGILVRP